MFKKISALVFISLFFFGCPANSEMLFGKVVRVIDGDTVVVLDEKNTQHKIRLQGIDAPERNQAFGKKSKNFLSDLIAAQTVKVEHTKKDRYGRIIGKIIFGNTDVNLEQVRAGYAWHYKKYEREQNAEDQVAYAHAEIFARENKFGLWNDPHAIPPWEWRKRKR